MLTVDSKTGNYIEISNVNSFVRRRESKDSRSSFESEVSIRIGNGSDVSDESTNCNVLPVTHEVRRKSWLEGYMHSVSLEQSSQLDVNGMNRTYR